MSKSVKVLMAFMVDYVLLFCLIKTFNPFDIPIANYFKYWNWEAYFSPDPTINCVFLMSFFSLILFIKQFFHSIIINESEDFC